MITEGSGVKSSGNIVMVDDDECTTTWVEGTSVSLIENKGIRMFMQGDGSGHNNEKY